MGAILPTPGMVRPVDELLLDRLNEWANKPSFYIADLVVPPTKVKNRGGVLMTVARANTFGDINAQIARSHDGPYAQSKGFGTATVSYACTEYSLESRVSKILVKDEVAGLNLRERGSQRALDTLRIAKEIRWAAKCFDTSTFTTTTLSGASQWSASTGDPMKDINDRVVSITQACGIPPNTCVLGWDAYNALKLSPAILSYLNVTRDRLMVNDNMLVSMLKDNFNFTNVQIGRAMYNTANQGQTASNAAIWGDFVGIGVIDAGGSDTGGGQMAVNPTSLLHAEWMPETLESFESQDAGAFVDRHTMATAEVTVDSAAWQIIADTKA